MKAIQSGLLVCPGSTSGLARIVGTVPLAMASDQANEKYANARSQAARVSYRQTARPRR